MPVPEYARYTLHRDLHREGWVIPQDCHDEHLWNRSFSEFRILQVRHWDKKEIGDAEMLFLSHSFEADKSGECAMAIFLDNQNQIPKNYRDGLLLFPGVIVLDPRGHRFIGVLFYAGDCWQRDFYIIADKGKQDINTWEDDFFVVPK